MDKKISQLLVSYTTQQTETCWTLFIKYAPPLRLSFMMYNFPLVTPVIENDFFTLASLIDIGCMKLSAITSRTAYKDYVDLYFILHEISLKTLIDHLRNKLPTLDPLLALKSLVYFNDIHPEEILYKTKPLAFESIKTYLQQRVEDYNQGI